MKALVAENARLVERLADANRCTKCGVLSTCDNPGMHVCLHYRSDVLNYALNVGLLHRKSPTNDPARLSDTVDVLNYDPARQLLDREDAKQRDIDHKPDLGGDEEDDGLISSVDDDLDDFPFDPCDGCGESLRCDANTFPCAVKLRKSALKLAKAYIDLLAAQICNGCQTPAPECALYHSACCHRVRDARAFVATRVMP
jgi:hypothetical protein